MSTDPRGLAVVDMEACLLPRRADRVSRPAQALVAQFAAAGQAGA